MNRLKDKVAISSQDPRVVSARASQRCLLLKARVLSYAAAVKSVEQLIVNEIQSAGGEAMYHFLDVTKPETVDALLADTEAAWGKVDVMVNNAAGMALKDGRVDEISLEDWDAVFASDIRSTFYGTKIALPYLKRNDKASIINIGSMAACSGDFFRLNCLTLARRRALTCSRNTLHCNMARTAFDAIACVRVLSSPKKTPTRYPTC